MVTMGSALKAGCRLSVFCSPSCWAKLVSEWNPGPWCSVWRLKAARNSLIRVGRIDVVFAQYGILIARRG